MKPEFSLSSISPSTLSYFPYFLQIGLWISFCFRCTWPQHMLSPQLRTSAHSLCVRIQKEETSQPHRSARSFRRMGLDVPMSPASRVSLTLWPWCLPLFLLLQLLLSNWSPVSLRGWGLCLLLSVSLQPLPSSFFRETHLCTPRVRS